MPGSDRKRTEQTGLPLERSVRRRVPVLLPYPFPGPFDYRVPRGMNPQAGDIVQVPLNTR